MASSAAPPPLLPAFLARLSRQDLIAPGARVIAAVSGGADSTCLLHLLLAARQQRGLTVEVAHFNHRLRGRQAERDAAAVGEVARGHGLRFHLGLGRDFTAAERRDASVQELARGQRLGFFLGLADRRRAVVALGHTADDQAETVLMRLLGGAGPAGLSGIPPASHGGRIVHPLLFARRAAIERWLAASGVRWRTDRSNRSRRYLRNRVRLELLPTIARAYNPRIVDRLCSLAECLRRDNDALEAEASRLLVSATTGPQGYRFSPQALSTAGPAVLARALLSAMRQAAREPADFGSRHIAALLAPGSGARSWDLPGGLVATRDGAGLCIAPRASAQRRTSLPRTVLSVPGSVPLPGGGAVTAETILRPPRFDARRFGANPDRVAIDLDRVTPPLSVRGRAPGDRFHPLGLAAGKKLKDFFIDAGIPAGERSRVPLVCDRDSIVWVAGLRPAEACKVDAGTQRLLVLGLERPRRPQGPVAGRATASREERGPATHISRSSNASSTISSGRVRLRTPSRAGSPAPPAAVTSTSSARTGRSRSSSSSAASGVRSDSADGTFTATSSSPPGRSQR